MTTYIVTRNREHVFTSPDLAIATERAEALAAKRGQPDPWDADGTTPNHAIAILERRRRNGTPITIKTYPGTDNQW